MVNGKSVARLSIATSQSWKDKSSGERKEKTEWHRVVVFNDEVDYIVALTPNIVPNVCGHAYLGIGLVALSIAIRYSIGRVRPGKPLHTSQGGRGGAG